MNEGTVAVGVQNDNHVLQIQPPRRNTLPVHTPRLMRLLDFN